MNDILLDEKIRDWVLLPIVLVVFLVAIVRQNVSLLLQADRKPELKKIQERYDLKFRRRRLTLTVNRQTLLRAQRLRANGKWLSQPSFEKRKKFFNDPVEGVFKEPEVCLLH